MASKKSGTARGAGLKRWRDGTNKNCFTVTERIFEAEERGIEPFASRVVQTEKRLLARALASKTASRAFQDAVWRFERQGVRHPELLERFFSFPKSVQRANVGVLESFYDVPRAQKTMRSFAEQAFGASFSAFAIRLGRLGGPGVLALLRRRLRELVAAVDAAPHGKVPEDLIEACTETAYGVLMLDPDATRAADVLIGIYRDPARYGTSSNALSFLREMVSRTPYTRTNAINRMRAALAELLEPDASEDDFAMAVPAMYFVNPKRTVARAEVTLFSTSWIVRVCVAQELTLRAPDRAGPLLLRYLAEHPADHGALSVARRMGLAVPIALRCHLAEHHLDSPSPRDRLDAADYLLATPGPRAVTIAARKARSEPEPLVLSLLRQLRQAVRARSPGTG